MEERTEESCAFGVVVFADSLDGRDAEFDALQLADV